MLSYREGNSAVCYHEARFTSVEEKRSTTLEVAQEETATPKASPPTIQVMMLCGQGSIV